MRYLFYRISLQPATFVDSIAFIAESDALALIVYRLAVTVDASYDTTEEQGMAKDGVFGELADT